MAAPFVKIGAAIICLIITGGSLLTYLVYFYIGTIQTTRNQP
jgi:hypothetical protein